MFKHFGCSACRSKKRSPCTGKPSSTCRIICLTWGARTCCRCRSITVPLSHPVAPPESRRAGVTVPRPSCLTILRGFRPRLSDVVTYSSETSQRFVFDGPAWDRYELYFARRLARLCAENGTKLVALHLPLLAEAQNRSYRHQRVGRRIWVRPWNSSVSQAPNCSRDFRWSVGTGILLLRRLASQPERRGCIDAAHHPDVGQTL